MACVRASQISWGLNQRLIIMLDCYQSKYGIKGGKCEFKCTE